MNPALQNGIIKSGFWLLLFMLTLGNGTKDTMCFFIVSWFLGFLFPFMTCKWGFIVISWFGVTSSLLLLIIFQNSFDCPLSVVSCLSLMSFSPFHSFSLCFFLFFFSFLLSFLSLCSTMLTNFHFLSYNESFAEFYLDSLEQYTIEIVKARIRDSL